MIKRRRSLAAIATLRLCAVGVAIFVAAALSCDGPLGVPFMPPMLPCVNSRPDEAGRSEPANDAYLDDRAIDWPTRRSVGGWHWTRPSLRAGLVEAERSPTLLSLLIARRRTARRRALLPWRDCHPVAQPALRDQEHPRVGGALGAAIGEGLPAGAQHAHRRPRGRDRRDRGRRGHPGRAAAVHVRWPPTGLNEADLVRDVAARTAGRDPGFPLGVQRRQLRAGRPCHRAGRSRWPLSLHASAARTTWASRSTTGM